MNKPITFPSRVVKLHLDCTAIWHTNGIVKPNRPIDQLILLQHRQNFDLWHEEDKARAPNANDSVIAQVKRNIDSLNQKRNDLITEIDESLEQSMFREIEGDSLPWNSETIGSIVDRLSIASLRVFHMQEQTERTDVDNDHIESCRLKTLQLEQQRDDLATALEQLISDIETGKKTNKLYRQFKMYNDPTLNPHIYDKTKTGY